MKNFLHPVILLLFIFTLFYSIESSAQCSAGEEEVTVKIHTDKWGSEITWNLKAGSETLLSGGPYADGSEIDDIQSVCVTEVTVLTFDIKDSYGDGICSGSGDGYYQIIAYDFIFKENCNYGRGETYTFTLESPSDLDGELSGINFSDYISQEYTLKGVLYNNGLTDITSIDLSWQINNGTINKQTITGFSVSSNQSLEIEHPTQIQFADSLISEEITIWISNPNALTDENTSNDTIIKAVEVLDEWVNRRVLIEHFTNASCGPCASQNPTLRALMEDGDNPDKIAHIAYHTSWPGTDPMYTFNDNNGEGDTRVSFYGVSGVPDAVVGGNNYQGGPAGISQNIIDEEYSTPGFFKVLLEQEIIADTIFIDVKLIALKDLTSNSLKAHIALTEYLEYESAPGSNGEKMFEDVMRTMLTGQEGYDLEPISAYDTAKIALKKQFDGFEIDEPRILIFVQDESDNDILMAYKLDENFAPPGVKTNVINGMTDFIIDEMLSFTFNDSLRNVDDSEITDLSSIISFKEDNSSGVDVSADISISDDKTKITIAPDNWLEEDKTYFLSIQPLENDYNISFNEKLYFFTTAIIANPTATFSIDDNETAIDVDTEPQIVFSDSVRLLNDTELIDPTSLIVFKETNETGTDVDFSATIDSDKDLITITPAEKLKLNQKYYLAIKAEVENRYNKALEEKSISFTTDITDGIEDLIAKYELKAYPIPCSKNLNINLNLQDNSNTIIGIYNISGQLVKEWNKGNMNSGNQVINLNLENIEAGLYIVSLRIGEDFVTKKIQVIK
ncbi:MAG: hypothetical protein C0597_13870 [Marinilabiliales bacterium]|nr:MAG: hypothetical protein C0597_13870 [Marinilabiliales bacterium]